MKLFQKGIFLIAIPLLAQFIFVIVLLVEYRVAEELTWKDVSFREKTSELVGISILCYKSVGLLSAYTASKDAQLLVAFESVYDQLVRKCEFLELLEQEQPLNKDATAASQSLKKTVNDLYEFKRFLTLPSKQYRLNIVLAKEAQADIGKALSDIERLIASRAKTGLPSSAQVERSRWIFVSAVIGGFAFNMLTASALLAFFARDFAGRFTILVDNTLKIADGKPLNKEIAGKDELKDLDRFIHSMNDSLKKAEDRKNELIQMVSHDLRGPLTSLNLSLALIKAGRTGEIAPATESRVDGAMRVVKRLSSLVNDILDMDKLRAGKMELRVLAVPAGEVVRDCFGELETLAASKGVVLKQSLSADLVIADRERLAQLFVNLLTNAIKYSPEGGIVEVRSLEEHDKVKFEIRDRGPGVPEEYRETIFLPFEQVPDEKRSKSGTTGLGLPICKMLVELHGGKIGVSPGENGGSVFWFTLPQAEIETI